MTGRRRPFPVPERHLPTDEAGELLALVREIAEGELLPVAAEAEERAARLQEYPRDAYRLLGKAGLLGLPYAEEHGGGGQPYEVYLQVLEELARSWGTVAMGVSVHVLACHAPGPRRHRGAGAAVAARPARRRPARGLLPVGGGGRLRRGRHAHPRGARRRRLGAHGTKAWITHARHGRQLHGVRPDLARPPEAAGRATASARSSSPPTRRGCPRPRRSTRWASPPRAPRRWSSTASASTATACSARRGRASRWPSSRWTPVGSASPRSPSASPRPPWRTPSPTRASASSSAAPSSSFQGLGLDARRHGDRRRRVPGAVPRRRPDAGRGGGADDPARLRATASMAKTFCTDAAVRVTTDAVQVLGGAGYVTDHRVERLMREAKLLQIVEGTNQVQRVVVASALARG